MKLKQVFFLIFFQLIIVSFIAQETAIQNAITLLSTKSEYVAGDKIILEFKTNKDTIIQLYCTNSYGSTVISPKILKAKTTFEIPSFFSKKRGLLTWKIINSSDKVSGEITIHAQQQPKTMETYLGPPSIDAGGTDYTMLVVIPTDSLDNPIKDNSKVLVKHQFLKSEKKENIYTDKLIAHKNLYSPLKSGRMIISSESFSLNSKEFDVNVMPAVATNFKLFFSRNHGYADGNQITTFYTSIIKDKNNNIVSDGSYIEFYITTKKGNILKTAGITINGIAHAKIVHPDFEEKWKVKAFFIGISESDVIEVDYKKVINDYNVAFSENNRTIKVGPLKSFMNQLIPDGLSVKISIYQNNKFINDIFKESRNGFAEFKLDANIFENNTYTLITETAGIKKEFKNLKLW
jgi:hypothetical protein